MYSIEKKKTHEVSEVSGLPLLDLTDPKVYRDYYFKKRVLFSAKIGDIFYVDKFKGRENMYGGEYINVKDRVHIAIVSNTPGLQPYVIRSRALDNDPHFPSPHLMSISKIDEGLSMIIFTGDKFIISDVKHITLNGDKSDISFRVRNVIHTGSNKPYPKTYRSILMDLMSTGLQIMNNRKPIPQSLLMKVNERSMMNIRTFIMYRNSKDEFVYRDMEDDKTYVLHKGSKWYLDNKDRKEITTVVIRAVYPKSESVRKSKVVYCFGEAYPDNMVFDISEKNRSLIELRKKEKEKNCQFKLKKVDTDHGEVDIMMKNGKEYILYTYGRNNSKIRKCILG